MKAVVCRECTKTIAEVSDDTDTSGMNDICSDCDSKTKIKDNGSSP